MKEYEIVAKFCNACAGSSRPQTFFEEAELDSTDDFVRMKHGKAITTTTLNTLCEILECRVEDILEYVPDGE